MRAQSSPPATAASAPAFASRTTGTSTGPPPFEGSDFGFFIFQAHCTACHGNPEVERAPTPAQLRQFSAQRIYQALTTGQMKAVGDTLNDKERRQVAESLAGKPLSAAAPGSAAELPNRCAGNPPMKNPADGPGWNGWGADAANTRFQSAAQAGIGADAVGRLKLKWVFGLPNATSAYGQPAIVAGRVFVGSDSGYVYALDANSGCVYWSFLSKAGVRNAMTVGPIHGHGGVRYAVYYGDLKANTYALDAQTGTLLWTRRVDPHYAAKQTAAPALYDGRLYVPVSAWEEFSASAPSYPCCTAVGSVVALDADTGRRIWKRYVITQRPRPVRRNSMGIQLWAPAGASVWNTPTVDARRNTVYVGTGDSTTYPPDSHSDSVLALDMKSGRVLWSHQVFTNDAFLGSCPAIDKPENCPKVQGPDFDIPAPVILRTVNGRDLLLVGTKPGDILALDPDHQGRQVWRMNVLGPPLGPAPVVSDDGHPTAAPGVLWGGAADQDTVYYGLNGGGLAAVRMADGQRRWLSSVGINPDAGVKHGAAATAVPGVIFLGGSDGKLSALSAADGKVLWQYATDRPFVAVDQVPTKGGSISIFSAAVAGGMLFVGSGYGVAVGTPGNALLAFGLD